MAGDLGAHWGAHGRAVPAAITDQSLTPNPLSTRTGLLKLETWGVPAAINYCPLLTRILSPLCCCTEAFVCVFFQSSGALNLCPGPSSSSMEETELSSGSCSHHGLYTPHQGCLSLHVPPLPWWLRRCWSAPGTAALPQVQSGLLPSRFHPCKQPRAFHQTCSSGEGALSLALLVSEKKKTSCQF